MVTEKRLIDAWDLTEWLDNFDRENTLRILRGKKAKLLNSHYIRNMIVTVPRVDAVEVVHGRWQPVDHDGSWRVDICSICHRRMHYVDYDQPYQYCPNCGAKMDGDGNG